MTVRPLAVIEIKPPILSPLKEPTPPTFSERFALILFDLYWKVKGAMATRRATPST